MIDSNKKLKRMQLSDALQAYPSPETAMPPRGGWVRAIREALGMTQAQLVRAPASAGNRCRISSAPRPIAASRWTAWIKPGAGDGLSRGLCAGAGERFTLDASARAACRLALAEALLQPADHSMKLEAQGVTAPGNASGSASLLAEALLNGSARKLWQ
jgi:hypothetical protein